MDKVETGWLIEKADNTEGRPSGSVVPGEALGVFYQRDGNPVALWGPYDKALRFARRIDAEAGAAALVPVMDIVAVEHQWGPL